MADRVFKNRKMMFLIIFLFSTLMILTSFTRYVANELAQGNPGKFRFFFIMETTGFYSILILAPLLLWFFNKFPIKRKNIYTRIPLHVLASMVFGVCHTMLMYSSRIMIYWIFNLGTYDYGQIGYRFLQEYSHQLFTYWLIFGIVLFIKSVQEVQEKKLQTSQLEQRLTKARLQALQAQIHPHFLFNTLNMISSIMYEDIKAADKMMANLSDLLRITLNSADCEEHTLEKELEILELYIEIMRARYNNKLVVKTEIDDNTLDALVPGFILQPLVENSIKYGMENLDITHIQITTQKENERLRLSITDNGPGIKENPNQIIKNGMGLSNTVERLEKMYGPDHRFHLRNIDKGGLQVAVEIPFHLSAMENR